MISRHLTAIVLSSMLATSLPSCFRAATADSDYPLLKATLIGTDSRDIAFRFASCEATARTLPWISLIIVYQLPQEQRFCTVSHETAGSIVRGTWRYGSLPKGHDGKCRPFEAPGRYRMDFSGSGTGNLTFEVDENGQIKALSDSC